MNQIFALWLHLWAMHALVPTSASSLLSDVVTVAATEEPLYPGPDGRLRTALVLLEWAARESGGLKSAVGSIGDCGRLQLVFLGAKNGFSCEEIRKPGTLDLSLGLRWMRIMRDTCNGSVLRGLAAYARGSCGSKVGIGIASQRLDEIVRSLP